MNLLFISYAFPPISSPGALRVYHFSRYLSQHVNYNVDVLYCKNGYSSMIDNNQVWDFGNLGLYPVNDLVNKNNIKGIANSSEKKIFSFKSLLKKIIFPDRDISWFVNIIKNNINIKQYDYIICSYPNITNLIVGYYFSRKKNIPLIVDMRDLWVQDSSYFKKTFFRRFFENYIEKKILTHANKILSVSQYNCKKLSSVYGDKVYTIYNGFDGEKFSSLMTKSCDNITSSRYRLVYAGSFYEGERKVDALFKAITNLKDKKVLNKENFIFEIYGNKENYITKLISHYNLNDLVVQMGLLGQEDLFKSIYNANLLLVITRELDISQGEMTTKFFEYIALGNEILCLSKENYEIVSVLNKIEGTYFCDLLDYQSIQNLLEEKLKTYPNFKELRRNTDYSFSRNAMSEKLKCLLEK